MRLAASGNPVAAHAPVPPDPRADPHLISPRWMATVAPSGTVLGDHSLLVRDGVIEAVMPTPEARRAYPGATETVLDTHLLTPGLVNAHTHAAMALLRGTADGLPLERWLAERIGPLEAALVNSDFVYDGTIMACAEMLLGGTTTFNDMYFFPDAAARAAVAMGMRGVMGLIIIDFPTAWAGSPDAYFEKGLALRDACRHEPLLTFALAPHAPYTVSDGPLERVARLSAELELPVHIHVHETAREVADHLSRHGQRPLARLAQLGLVSPDLMAVHGVHLDASDQALLAEHGASLVHCPNSNLKLGSGIAPVPELLTQGANVAIGTDGSASNNRLDMVLEARMASLLASGRSGDPSCMDAHRALEAATLGGARALGMEDQIGAIAPGRLADLAAFDLSDENGALIVDPVSHLLFSGGREQVSHVWVQGRPVVVMRQIVATAALDALAGVRARRRVWHNRAGQVVPEGGRTGIFRF
ncbi:MAG: TRZ/ATZ family hydrolase [Burkholderiaceae bacterium]